MGVTGTITVDLAVVKLGYMLERPSILHYSLRCKSRGSENVTGGENQQETALAGSSETARQAPLEDSG